MIALLAENEPGPARISAAAEDAFPYFDNSGSGGVAPLAGKLDSMAQRAELVRAGPGVAPKTRCLGDRLRLRRSYRGWRRSRCHWWLAPIHRRFPGGFPWKRARDQ